MTIGCCFIYSVNASSMVDWDAADIVFNELMTSGNSADGALWINEVINSSNLTDILVCVGCNVSSG